MHDYQYKSSELRLFLFHWCLPLLLSCWKEQVAEDNDNFWHFFALYILGVCILYEPSNADSINQAKRLIQSYHHYIEDHFGQGAYTYTIHAHLHLANQVLRHGPLHSHTQFVFEVNSLHCVCFRF